MKKCLFLIVLFFISCTAKNNNEIPVFNDITFKVLKNEKAVHIQKNIQQDYASYFVNKNLQIPLFRYIESNGYRIFIGIPFETSIAEMIKFNPAVADTNAVLVKTDSVFYCYKRYTNGNNYVSEYTANFNNNLIYLLAETNSAEKADSLFNQVEMAKRLFVNKK